jgi:hypothetical protein
MSTLAMPPSAPETPAPIGALSRVFGVFFSPKATFESIAARPTWIVPVILICLMQIAVVSVFSHRVGWRSMIEKQDANNSRMEGMPPDQLERAVALQVKYAPIAGYFFAAVGPFLGVAVVGGVLLGLFNGVGGGRMQLKTSLGVVSHAWMPGLIAGLLGIIILFLEDPSSVDLQNLVASNPGVLLSDSSPRWMVSLLGSLDIFSFWTMLLMAVGFHAANPRKISFGKAIGVILFAWAFYVVFKVGLTAAFF